MGVFLFQKLNNPTVEQVRLNLICFHWAGGSGAAFKPMAKALEASNICVFAVTLPGRNGRGTASMFRNMKDIIISLSREFSTYYSENSLGSHPVLFFGHSFGGLLAYELYKAFSLGNDKSVVIDKVIVSAVRCPSNLTELNKKSDRMLHHKQSDNDLIEYMRGIGGIPPGVDLSIIELMLPTIKGDYEVFETYDMAAFGNPVLNCPITLFYAKKDTSIDDQPSAHLGWEEHTSEEFTLVEFEEGTHFYVTDAGTKDEFYGKLREECEKHIVEGSTCTLN